MQMIETIGEYNNAMPVENGSGIKVGQLSEFGVWSSQSEIK